MTIMELLNKAYPYRKIILTIVGLAVLLVAVIFTFNKCSQYLLNREIDGDKDAINGLLINANHGKENLVNLTINEALREQEVNLARNDLRNKREATNESRQRTDNALQRVNRIESSDYNGKTLSEANEARCRAFPESKGCQK